MISQRCPKCYSSRIRAGYRPTPLWSKLLFRYNLLCDSCNWEFKGFAVPGTVSSRSRSSKKKQTASVAANKEADSETSDKNGKITSDGKQTQIKKRVKVKFKA